MHLPTLIIVPASEEFADDWQHVEVLDTSQHDAADDSVTDPTANAPDASSSSIKQNSNDDEAKEGLGLRLACWCQLVIFCRISWWYCMSVLLPGYTDSPFVATTSTSTSTSIVHQEAKQQSRKLRWMTNYCNDYMKSIVWLLLIACLTLIVSHYSRGHRLLRVWWRDCALHRDRFDQFAQRSTMMRLTYAIFFQGNLRLAKTPSSTGERTCTYLFSTKQMID